MHVLILTNFGFGDDLLVVPLEVWKEHVASIESTGDWCEKTFSFLSFGCNVLLLQKKIQTSDLVVNISDGHQASLCINLLFLFI
jgi:hypothetical protein